MLAGGARTIYGRQFRVSSHRPGRRVTIQALNHRENQLIARLVTAGLTQSEAILAVVMTTRGYARPKGDLSQILAQYPVLDSDAVLQVALNRLLDRGWLRATVQDGTEPLVHQDPELRSLIAQLLDDPGVAEALRSIRSDTEPLVEVVGPMKDAHVYRSFIGILRAAQATIFLPMLATPPYTDVVDALVDRAKAGVRIRVLLAAPSLVETVRGSHMAQLAGERIREWVRLLDAFDSVEIRLYRRPAAMRYSSWLLVDGVKCRIDIYDPRHQRSLEGVMLEIVSPPGLDLNLVSLVTDGLEQAWATALPLGYWSRLVKHARFHWPAVTGAAALGIALFLEPAQAAQNYMFGVSSSLVATAIIRYRHNIASGMRSLAGRIGEEDG
jgi:hypothetical protein